jgi:hypothetical protein
VARTPTAPGPLDTLEAAFDLLQQAAASVWLRYFAGAAPLLIGLLFVWNEFSGIAASNQNPILAASLLLLLTIWFYRCRQIFAGSLRRSLSLTSDAPKRTAWTLACFEGTKLLLMPNPILSLFPIALASAFYRSLTLFAGQGLAPADALRKALKTSGTWQRENFLTLAILALLGLAVFIDVALTVIIAPMLLRIFTGYESIFTQRGSATLAIQFPIILALTWLCFDPLLQAIYTVRAFHWDGLSTGEDLLVRLKRIAPAILLAILCATQLSAQNAVSRDSLNKSIDRTLQSGDYAWRNPPAAPGATEKKDWFLDPVDRALALLRKGWKAITDFASDVMDWIDRMLRPIMPAAPKDEGGKPSGVRPAFYLIGILMLALAAVLLWKFGPRRKPLLPSVPPAATAIDLQNEIVLASDLPEDEWLRLADQHAASGDLRLALRALYLGTLALLNRRGFLTIHACKSNRDYERELRRRARDGALAQIFGLNIRSFEQSWYGFHEVTNEQLAAFRVNLGRLRA